jgi:hypothetical protein
MRNWECGLRPLRAVGSLYEPEAVGASGAYAPEGRGNEKGIGRLGDGASRVTGRWDDAEKQK